MRVRDQLRQMKQVKCLCNGSSFRELAASLWRIMKASNSLIGCETGSS